MGILDDERIQAASDLRVRSMAAATNAAHRSPFTAGAHMIARERKRQTEDEGYTAQHDRGRAEELGWAGAAYALGSVYVIKGEGTMPSQPSWWPWAQDYWKPTGDPVRDLTKAGALIAAAIDSLLAEQASMDAGKES